MPLFNLRPVASARRRMNMFYLIDTSGSMNKKNCIGSVNRAMPEIVEILKEISRANNDHSDIYMSCITYNNTARRLYDAPVNVKDFRWVDVEAMGLTNLKAGLDMLEAQMEQECRSVPAGQLLRPAVLLMSDGDPDPGWEETLARLQNNCLFRQAYKIAIAIGCKPDNKQMQRALSLFAQPLDAGGEPLVITVDHLDTLYRVLKMVSTTVSRIGSRNIVAPGSSTAEEICREIRDDAGNIIGVDIPPMKQDGIGWY